MVFFSIMLYLKGMLNIYIARHGQDLDNEKGILNGHRDEALSSLGLRQAEELASLIASKSLNFDNIYSSPLRRAFQTAKTVSEKLGSPEPEVLPALIERDFGIMTGKKVADIEKICAPDIIKTERVVYFLSPEGAESFPRLLERAKTVLTDILNKHQDGNVLLVAHGDIGKMIYAAYYNLDWRDVLNMFHFGNSELLSLSPNHSAEDAHIFQTDQFNN